MKNIIFIFVILISLLSCKEEAPKDYVTIEGIIENNDAKNIDITQHGLNKRIEVNLDGTFKDTLKLYKPNTYTFYDGKNKMILFLKNGDFIKLQYKFDDFAKSISFKGNGFETTKYLLERRELDKSERVNDRKAFYKLSKEDFFKKVNGLEQKFNDLLKSDKIDSTLKERELKRNKQYIAYIKQNYMKEHEFFTKFAKGNPSPKFVDYLSDKGKKYSLDNFKEKYVYIDVWATWCGPCKREIPHLKKLVEKYKNKNIQFISISVDNGRGYKNDATQAKNGWKRMIFNRKMNWLQLYATKAWNSAFVRAYGIRSIPRFILIDPKGNIVDANAARPSNPKLQQLLDGLLK